MERGIPESHLWYQLFLNYCYSRSQIQISELNREDEVKKQNKTKHHACTMYANIYMYVQAHARTHTHTSIYIWKSEILSQE